MKIMMNHLNTLIQLYTEDYSKLGQGEMGKKILLFSPFSSEMGV